MEHTIVIGLCKTLHIRSFYELNKHTSFPTIEGLLAKKTIRGNRKQNSHYLLYFLESCKYWISDMNVYRKTKYVRCCIEFNDMVQQINKYKQANGVPNLHVIYIYQAQMQCVTRLLFLCFITLHIIKHIIIFSTVFPTIVGKFVFYTSSVNA